MTHQTAWWWRALLVLLLVTGIVAQPPAARAGSAGLLPHRISLQVAFDCAAREFGVPRSVLLSVSYNETRWEDHGSAPSAAGGYGPMHLVHVDRLSTTDAKGDGITRSIRRDPSLHTLDKAARLLHLSVQTLEADPVQNIRGGAALLARYARRTAGTNLMDAGRWYGAVAAYSGSRQADIALGFADRVYATIRRGMQAMVNGRRIVLSADPVRPDRSTTRALGLRPAQQTVAECPKKLACQFLPAAYALVNPLAPTDYGNYDVANRAKARGLRIRYIVIHDTEGSYSSALSTFQDPRRYASANYVIRSADGQITQMVHNKDIAWHAGNYYVNMHSIGIEHEGVAIQGATWYGEQLYQSSATLVRYLAHRYHMPLDRAHVLGHDEVAGPSPLTQAQQHWDPGPFWDWHHYLELLGVPLQDGNATGAADVPHIITIDPVFASNQPPVSYCYSATDCRTLPPEPSGFVYLRTAPRPDAPLLSDPAVHPSGDAGTTKADDWGDKAVTGQQFVRLDRTNDWDKIDYGGQEAWLYDPADAPTTIIGTGADAGTGTIITPRAGVKSIYVYGRAYPEKSAYPKGIKPESVIKLQYSIPAGQQYVAIQLLSSDFYWSPTQTNNRIVTGKTKYYEIFFNHRHAFVKASDVYVVNP